MYILICKVSFKRSTFFYFSTILYQKAKLRVFELPAGQKKPRPKPSAGVGGGTILTFFGKKPTFYIRPDGFECSLIYPTII